MTTSREELLKRANSLIQSRQGQQPPKPITTPDLEGEIQPLPQEELQAPAAAAPSKEISKRDQLMQKAQKLLQDKSQSVFETIQREQVRRENPPTMTSAVAQGFAQGATAEFGDEIGRVIGDPEFQIRAKNSQEEYPLTFAIGQVVGFIASPIGKLARGLGLGRSGRAAEKAGEELTTLQSIRGAAAEGALIGAGTGDSAESRIMNAALLAGAAPAAEKTVAGVISATKGSRFVERGLERIAKEEGNFAQRQAAKALTNEKALQFANIAGDMAAFTNAGGFANIILNNPQDIDEAIKLYKEGASISAYAGAGLIITRSGFSKVQDLALGARQFKIKRDAADIQADINIKMKQLKAEEVKADQVEKQIISSSKRLSSDIANLKGGRQGLKKAQQELDELQVQESLMSGVLDAREPITQRVARMGRNLKGIVQGRIDQVQAASDDIANTAFQGQRVDITDFITNTQNKLNKVTAVTPEEQAALSKAQGFLRNLQAQGRVFNENVMTSGKPKTKITIDARDLHIAKKQFGSTLYDKNWWLGSKGTGLRETMTGLERGISERLGKLDGSGQWTRNNNMTHNMLNASREIDSINWTAQAAKPGNPDNLRKMEELQQYFLPKRSNKQIGLKGGYSDDVLNDIASRDQMTTVGKLLDAEISAAGKQYRLLQKAERIQPQLASNLNKARSEMQTQQARIAQSRAKASESRDTLFQLRAEKAVAPTRAERRGLQISRAETRLQNKLEELDRGLLGSLRPFGLPIGEIIEQGVRDVGRKVSNQATLDEIIRAGRSGSTFQAGEGLKDLE